MSTGFDHEGNHEFETSEAIKVVATFDQLDLKHDLLKGIHTQGIEKPSTIQQHALLPMISGRNAIIQAPSGAGKTTMLSIAILQLVDTSSRDTQALILEPTRELANATQRTIASLGQTRVLNVMSRIH
ncbi:hypothetical protein FRC03_010258 [Tulasnella sp. 419]|nr:hypothetical protein FRC03_010258 [Tulasnella sp. 419]